MHNKTTGDRDVYLKNIKRSRRSVIIGRWAILIGLLILWELGNVFGFIDVFLLSSPSRIIKTTVNLFEQGDLFMHVGVTLWETLLGFLIGGVAGTLLAIALWWSQYLSRVMDVYIVVLNSLPKIALGPILIVWIGAGMPAIVAMAVLISIVATLMTTLTGFKEVPQEKIFLMRSFGATKWQILTMVILPASIPSMLAALKLNIGLSWVGVIVGEFLVSRAGLGYLIVYGGQVFKLDLVMTATVILCVLAAGMYFGVAWLEKRAVRRR